MLSGLEYMLLRRWLPDLRTDNQPHICERLFQYLEDSRSLLRLRVTSWTLKELVDRNPERLFRNLYIRAPLDLVPEDGLDALERLLTFCYDLTITIRATAASNDGQDAFSDRLGRALDVVNNWSSPMTPSAPPRPAMRLYSDNNQNNTITAPHMRLSVPLAQPSHKDQVMNELSRRQWLRMFSHCHQVQTLTFRVHGNPSWPGYTDIEDTLITIRLALEKSRVQRLLEIHFAPVHAMGIIHLRWTGLSAFGHPPLTFPPTTTLPTIWSRITTLDLQVLNPFTTTRALSPAQSTMFKKVLYSYLHSFTATLQILRFVWRLPTNLSSTPPIRSTGSTPGPSPITLHLDPSLASDGESRSPLRWEALRGLWLGNIVFPHQTVRVLRQDTEAMAPKLEKLYVLRSTGADRIGEGLDEQEVWIDVSLDRSVGHVEGLGVAQRDTASSFYSQSARTSAIWAVSSTSRSIPVMLDLASLQR